MKFIIFVVRGIGWLAGVHPRRWRAIIRAFERAMLQSMREGGSLFEQFGSPHAGEHDDRRDR